MSRTVEDLLGATLLKAMGMFRVSGEGAPLGQASNARYFGPQDISLSSSSPRRYSLLCHETRTRVVVGGEGINEAVMIPAIGSEGAMEAFCAFLMHNRCRSLQLHQEYSAEPSAYDDYYEFSAWSQEAPT